jgi:hypothetical protein
MQLQELLDLYYSGRLEPYMKEYLLKELLKFYLEMKIMAIEKRIQILRLTNG